MKYIYMLVVLFALYQGRHYIVSWFKDLKNKTKKTTEVTTDDVTFTPVETRKTYVFAVELEELTDGKAKLSIIKMPQ